MKQGIGTSLPEQTLFFYVKRFFHDAISRKKLKSENGFVEVDIFIPSINIAIEYDGLYYHKHKLDIDERKNSILNEMGIYTIRIREKGLPQLRAFNGELIELNTSRPILQGSFEYIEKTISIILQFCGEKNPLVPHLDYDMFLSDAPQIYSLIYCNKVIPNISDFCGIEYWQYERNHPLSAENIPKDDWAHAILKCPEGKEIILPRYHRKYKEDCKSAGMECDDCLYGIYCPLIYACHRGHDNQPVKCKYVEELVMRDALSGKTYMEKRGEHDFYSWLFNESDCGMKIIRMFLDFPSESIYRENILLFFMMRKGNNGRVLVSTEFPAWTFEHIELLKRFRLQIKGAKISIRDRTEDRPGIRRTKPYTFL